MNKDNADTASITLSGSSLPFVLIGPAGRHRRVLVKSVENTLDLIGLDGLPENFDLRSESSIPSALSLFGLRSRAQRNIVRSGDIISVGEGDYRKSHYSFAWHGLASRADRSLIAEQISRIAPDLEYALGSKSVDDVEFVLSSIVLVCQQANERRQRSIFMMKSTIAITAFIYAILGLSAAYFRL